jgi:hypothetical protein
MQRGLPNESQSLQYAMASPLVARMLWEAVIGVSDLAAVGRLRCTLIPLRPAIIGTLLQTSGTGVIDEFLLTQTLQVRPIQQQQQ